MVILSLFLPFLSAHFLTASLCERSMFLPAHLSSSAKSGSNAICILLDDKHKTVFANSVEPRFIDQTKSEYVLLEFASMLIYNNTFSNLFSTNSQKLKDIQFTMI